MNKKINIHKSTVDITLITKNPIVSKILYIIRYPSKWRLLFRAAAYVLLFDLAFVYLFPFIYMVVTSLKSPEDLADFTVNWIPKGIYLGNYIIAFGLLEYLNRLKNSIIITSLSIIGHVLSCSLIGYGFARFKFAAKKIMFIMVIMTIIVPVEVIIIPMFMQYSNLGWLNSYRPLIIPTFFGFGLRGGLFIFIFRQFFMGFPHSLEDAARIDGCNFFETYWRIVLPISKPAVLVTSILAMVWHWNDYFEPNIYIGNPRLAPLPYGLNDLYNALQRLEEGAARILETFPDIVLEVNEAVVMASTFLVIAPVLIVYAFLQSHFVESVERTGLTE